jgi:hypothetical protein
MLTNTYSRGILETSKHIKGLQILGLMFVKSDTLIKWKVFRQEFYAGGLTGMISLGNMPISKVVKDSDTFLPFRGRQKTIHLVGEIVFEPFFYSMELKIMFDISFCVCYT